jgi:hypothetical protein
LCLRHTYLSVNWLERRNNLSFWLFLEIIGIAWTRVGGAETNRAMEREGR